MGHDSAKNCQNGASLKEELDLELGFCHCQGFLPLFVYLLPVRVSYNLHICDLFPPLQIRAVTQEEKDDELGKESILFNVFTCGRLIGHVYRMCVYL